MAFDQLNQSPNIGHVCPTCKGKRKVLKDILNGSMQDCPQCVEKGGDVAYTGPAASSPSAPVPLGAPISPLMQGIHQTAFYFLDVAVLVSNHAAIKNLFSMIECIENNYNHGVLPATNDAAAIISEYNILRKRLGI